jgi:ABC-type transport system substrate-binding protein
VISGQGNRFAEETAQVIDENLHDVGIDAKSSEVPPQVLVGGFPANSPLSLGTFDLVVFSRGLSVDPQSSLYSQYASNQVPGPQLQSGSNFDRVQDPRIDQALLAAGATLDDAQRQAAYVSVAQLIQADEAVIPLFPALQMDARKNYVEGWGPTNGNDFFTWNIQDWWLNQ